MLPMVPAHGLHFAMKPEIDETAVQSFRKWLCGQTQDLYRSASGSVCFCREQVSPVLGQFDPIALIRKLRIFCEYEVQMFAIYPFDETLHPIHDIV